jgi:hypothetical protein
MTVRTIFRSIAVTAVIPALFACTQAVGKGNQSSPPPNAERKVLEEQLSSVLKGSDEIAGRFATIEQTLSKKPQGDEIRIRLAAIENAVSARTTPEWNTVRTRLAATERAIKNATPRESNEVGARLAAIQKALDASTSELNEVRARLAAIEKAIYQISPMDRGELAVRLTAIEKAIDNEAKGFWKTVMPAIVGLLGVVAGGILQAFLADKKTKEERLLAENRAKLEIGNSFVQWQLKQISELYGPLHALLGQSNAIYRQMNNALSAAAASRFRVVDGDEDFDKKEFQISLDGKTWTRFRTVLHIAEVYGKGYGVEGYFDELIGIGKRMVKIIEAKAGYVRPEQKELHSVFGQYLAHYAILMRLHSARKARFQLDALGGGPLVPVTFIDPSKIHESAAFPQRIQDLVDDGFTNTNNELQAWRAKAAT